MLTPMLVQYLVGLCCVHHNPDAIDVTIGDLVRDSAAGKERDVDVTVTITEEDGSVRAFKAHEVKQEGKPLDVASVEQLCAKLQDMPDVTHGAIVSTSGFTDGAINKAAARDVDLYIMGPWAGLIGKEFPDFAEAGKIEEFFSTLHNSLLYWIDYKIFAHTIKGPSSFKWIPETRVFTHKGKTHKPFANMAHLTESMLFRSTEILFQIDPAWTLLRTFPFYSVPDITEFQIGPAWPHTHTLQTESNKAFLKFDDKLCLIGSITITGSLRWQRRKMVPQFYILEKIPDGSVFAGAIIADYGVGDGRMLAIIFPPKSRELGIHIVQLTEKQRNIIRGLKIKSPE